MEKESSKIPNSPGFKSMVIQVGNECQEALLPLTLESLPEEFRLKAKMELNETDECRTKGLQKLKEYVERENLQLSTDNDFLLAFLRAAKFNTKKAEQRIRRFISFRKILLGLLESTDMDKIKHVIDCQTTGLLPYRDKQGRAIVYTRGYAWNKELFELSDVAACMLSLVLFASTYPLTSVSGVCYIAEAKVNTLYDLVPIGNVIRAYASFLNSFPIRFQRVDVLNENYLCRCVFMAVRPILPTKLTKRVFLHGSESDILFKGYPPSLLPFEFGGTLGPLSPESYKEKFLEFVQKLKSEGLYGR